MDKQKALKIGGILAVAVGSGALYVSGATDVQTTGLVGALFIVFGLIASMFKRPQ